MTEQTFHIDNPSSVTFEVDAERRTIRGLVIPYGDVATSKGKRWTFSKDTEFVTDRTKALVNHDWTQLRGTATLEAAEDGLFGAVKVGRGAAGDQLLMDAEDGLYDGLSAGLAENVKATLKDGVYHVTYAELPEISLTPLPAFNRARVTSVAASAALNEKETAMTEQTTAPEAPPEFAATLDALNQKVADLSGKVVSLESIKVPVEAAATLSVTEEPIYRFGGHEPAPSGFDFATDLLAAANGDGAALERVREFTAANLGPEFVTTANVATVNQSVYRPDLFLGQAPVPQSPLFDTFRKGGLSDVTPFFYTKLDRAATTVAVANHVEGTEPALTNLVTAAGATVTPTAVSGRVHVTREVADQGGTPQVSGLVWAEFERSYKISLETKTAALIAASDASITALTAAIAAGASGAVAGAAIEAGLIGLQFIPDGSRFTKAFGHVDLYTKLATFENSDGSKRYPIINPQNRDGISGSKYSFIDIAGYRMEPTASLGATSVNASSSYVADPNAVHVWNSGLQRLEKLQEKVEGWDIGCFGYFAGIVYDLTGLRKISYDPV